MRCRHGVCSGWPRGRSDSRRSRSPGTWGVSASGGLDRSGSATINGTTIRQHTEKAIIDWLRFNVGAGERVRFLQRMGSAKPWFIFHMVCGVVGPMAVIYHSTFRIGSQNALVAMVSMLLVAGGTGRPYCCDAHRKADEGR